MSITLVTYLDTLICISYALICVSLLILNSQILQNIDTKILNSKIIAKNIFLFCLIFLTYAIRFGLYLINYPYAIVFTFVSAIVSIVTLIYVITNVVTLRNSINELLLVINDRFQEKAVLHTIKNNSYFKIAVIKISDSNNNSYLLWCTQAFYDWFCEGVCVFSDKHATSSAWYEKHISIYWKEELKNVAKLNNTSINQKQYIKEKDRYIYWTMSSLGNNKVIFIFEDITDYVKHTEYINIKMEEQKVLNKTLLNLGLEEAYNKIKQKMINFSNFKSNAKSEPELTVEVLQLISLQLQESADQQKEALKRQNLLEKEFKEFYKEFNNVFATLTKKILELQNDYNNSFLRFENTMDIKSTDILEIKKELALFNSKIEKIHSTFLELKDSVRDNIRTLLDLKSDTIDNKDKVTAQINNINSRFEAIISDIEELESMLNDHDIDIKAYKKEVNDREKIAYSIREKAVLTVISFGIMLITVGFFAYINGENNSRNKFYKQFENFQKNLPEEFK